MVTEERYRKTTLGGLTHIQNLNTVGLGKSSIEAGYDGPLKRPA